MTFDELPDAAHGRSLSHQTPFQTDSLEDHPHAPFAARYL